MSTEIQKIVSSYKTLSKIPTLVNGYLRQGNRVTTKWSTRNLDKGKHTKYLFNYGLDLEFNVISESDFGVDISNELLSAVSKSEKLKAIIRDEKEAKKQYLEVWSANQMLNSIDLTALELHGDVYADSEFGCLSWSEDEKQVLYVAEKKLPKSEAYIKRKPKQDDDAKKPTAAPGEEYTYKQEWGEQLVGKHLSVVCVCDVQTESVSVLEGVPEGWCPGQVRFMPDGSVVGVAWRTNPRLGLIFCTNRWSRIFRLTLDGQLTYLSEEGKAVRSPRVINECSILWLERDVDGPHNAAHDIVLKDLKTDKKTIVIPSSIMGKTANGKDFFGMYSIDLPQRCITNDHRLIFSTPQSTEVRSYVVNTETLTVCDISNSCFKGSTTILDVHNDVVLAACSNLTTPHQLFAAKLPQSGSEDGIKWHRISKPVEVPESISSAQVEYMHLEHKDSGDSVKSFSAIYLAPKNDSGRSPLIVWPHGGPHGCFANSFGLEAALYTMMGFISLQINYRGSIGQGQSSVEFLLGRAGSADVVDCHLATTCAIQRPEVDERRVFLTGGSHGGFLVTHLSGQFPDVYKAVVTKNPVTDVATMINSTDIPDWCAVEAGFHFTESGPVSSDHLLAMRRCSPLAHVHKVVAPTALMLGSADKRVPHYQGLEYYRRLKANGVETRVYLYDDNHSLSSLPHEMDNLINSVSWFCKHMD